jgi:ankyrin repeat protein
MTAKLKPLTPREKEFVGAAAAGDAGKVRERLKDGVPVDVLDNRNAPMGQTALMHAAENGHLEVVKVLLDAGANAKATDKPVPSFPEAAHGRQPLHYAMRSKNIAVAEMLLDAGADPNALDSHGDPPINFAIRKDNVPGIELLMKRGAEINLKTKMANCCPPVYMAVSETKPAIVELLLRMGADPNASHETRLTPLMLAACVTPKSSISVLSGLLKAGVPAQMPVRSVADSVAMMKALLRAGAKVDHKDKSGDSALFHAVLHKNVEGVKLLVQAGADLNEHLERPSGTILDFVEKRLQSNQDDVTNESLTKEQHDESQKSLLQWTEILEVLRQAVAKRQSELGGQSSQFVSKPPAKSSLQPQLAQKTASPPLGIKDFLTAVYTTETEFSLVAIKAPLKDVRRQFAELYTVSKWVRRVPLKQAEKNEGVDAKLIGVVGLKTGDWTIFFRSIFFSNDEVMSQVAAYARQLSAKLKTRAISFVGEGTCDVMGYELYEKGEKLEEVQWDAGLDILSFESKLRKKPSQETIGDEWADKLFRSEGIYLPVCYPRSENGTSWLAVQGASADSIAEADIIEP